VTRPAGYLDASIVTVCYNDLERLRRTTASVDACRDQVQIEHIIVDGGSDDGTRAWGDRWAEQGSGRRFISERDDGIFDAMNKGVGLVEAEFILFLNAGDVLADPQALTAGLAKVVERHAQWGYGVAQIVDSAGVVVRPNVGRVPYSRWHHLYGFATICHQAVLMRGDFIGQLGGFQFAKFGWASDYALLIRAASHSDPVTWRETTVCYESGGVSEKDVYRQLWRRHRARRGVPGALPSAIDAGWTALQCLRVGAGAILRMTLPRLGLTRVMGRDLARIEANR
tara:strand:+ start:2573 stop:3421 length:849 start_codon:yes stop_codon:yes gene_type:complete